MIQNIFHIVMHLSDYLPTYFQEYGTIIYLVLFAIIFCETGLVITPFLPGDSLIFAASAVAVGANANIFILFVVFFAAAILGNTSNYYIGLAIGKKIYNKPTHRFIKKESLDSAMDFFNRRGGAAIILTRFMPIIRTFTPFVAGISEMKARSFTYYNLIGGFLWVAVFAAAGYFFGEQPFVKDNISTIMIAIVVISLLPAIITWVVKKIKKQKV